MSIFYSYMDIISTYIVELLGGYSVWSLCGRVVVQKVALSPHTKKGKREREKKRGKFKSPI